MLSVKRLKLTFGMKPALSAHARTSTTKPFGTMFHMGYATESLMPKVQKCKVARTITTTTTTSEQQRTCLMLRAPDEENKK